MNFKNIAVIFLANTLTSCSMNAQEILLPGKIAIELGVGVTDTCLVYDGDKKYKFTLNNSKLKSYSDITWINTENAFLFTEIVKGEKNRNLKSSFVKLDLNGNVIDRVFEVKYPQSIGLTFLSKNDSHLLFLSSIENENADVLEIFNKPESIVIMDFKSRKIIRTLDTIGALHLQIEESPWLPDENRFVYSITNDRQVEVDGQVSMKMEQRPGVYLYDVIKGTSTLLISDANHASSCPVRDEVAFMKDSKIGIYKLQDGSIKWLYGFNKSSIMHWAPDGNYIYLLDYDDWGNRSKEKLIRISDGEEVPFKKVKHGYYSFTWK